MIARVAQEYDLLVAADEIYTTFIYDGEYVPMRTLPGMEERVITLNSFSKNFMMTGWRVGAIIAQPELVRAMLKINSSLIYTTPSVSPACRACGPRPAPPHTDIYVTSLPRQDILPADRLEKIPYLSLVRPARHLLSLPRRGKRPA